MGESITGTGSSNSARVGLLLGPLLFLLCLLTQPPAGMGETAWAVVGMALLMATWWATEAIPIPATALLPMVLIPALGIDTPERAAAPYANPTIYLFFGGFVLGLAMERCNLHRRLALMTLRAVGVQPSHQIAGFMLATAFLSMWVSNTATTIMMLPIGLSVIALVTPNDGEEGKRFATSLLLAIPYAASIGGVATLIGTPPNALLAAYLRESYQLQIGFGQWMLLGLPVSLTMLLIAWWWLTRGGFRLAGVGSGELIRDELAGLGRLATAEKRVAMVFVLTALAWILQPLLSRWVPGVNDSSIALAATLSLFLLPDGGGRRLMDWPTASRLPWGVLLLFGGGLSLANVIRATGLAEWIAGSLGVLDLLPTVLLLALVVTVILFLTEINSNTATAAAFLPLLGALAVAQGLPPQLLAVPAAVAASFAFMMPVATPPNAIVFGSGLVTIQAMMRAGLVLNLFGVVVISLLCYLLVGLIWP